MQGLGSDWLDALFCSNCWHLELLLCRVISHAPACPRSLSRRHPSPPLPVPYAVADAVRATVTGRQQRQRKQSRWLQETFDPNAGGCGGGGWACGRFLAVCGATTTAVGVISARGPRTASMALEQQLAIYSPGTHAH